MTGTGPDRRVCETRSRSNNIGCQAVKTSGSVVASKRMGTILIIVALCLSGLGAPAYGSSLLHSAATLPDPADEAALRNLAHEFFAIYSSGDLVGFMSLWTPDSPELAERRDKARQFFVATEQVSVKNISFLRVDIAGDKATVWVSLEMTGV